MNRTLELIEASTTMLMPCFFLYFQNIVYENKFKLGNWLHFIVPILLGSIVLSSNFINSEYRSPNRPLFIFIAFGFYLAYAVISFVMLYKNVWNRKTDIKSIQKQNDIIKNWSKFLYGAFIALLLTRMILIFSDTFIRYNYDHLWFPALIWMGVFIKLFLTPEILYGYNFLNKPIETGIEKVILNNVWLTENTLLPTSSEKDRKLEEKIKPLVNDHINRIERYSFHTHAFRDPDLGIEDIADALSIPISHLNYIFKYHCNESFTDYKKIVRIHDAIQLLKERYLDKHKLESLSSEVGFSSYNTFHLAFKNITGLTANEYAKRF
jgi:AraC-like DNA-binding protein